MLRHLHTFINYSKLIEMQANQVAFGPVINKKATLKRENYCFKVKTMCYKPRYKTHDTRHNKERKNLIFCREE